MNAEILVTYKPLRHTLVEKESNITTLCKDLGISTVIRRNLFNDTEYVALSTIVKICRHLDVPIEEVVEVIAD